MGIYWWINKNVLTDPRFYDPTEVKKTKKEKPKMSLKESFGYLAKSKYIGCLAILVIGYEIAINLVVQFVYHLLLCFGPWYSSVENRDIAEVAIKRTRANIAHSLKNNH